MSNRKFVIADVFTEKIFGGNQLAVFTDGVGLDAQTMQKIAREMHFSETTFLFPPEQGGDFKVRIFTPEHELPFAGHPVVGTAHVIVAERMKQSTEPVTAVTLETGVGPLLVEVNIENGHAGHTVMNQPLPVVKGTFSEVAAMAKALSLDASEIEQTGLPIEIIYNGITMMVVPVASREAIERIKVDSGALEQISKDASAETVLTFTRETISPSSHVHCRVFAPAAGVAEDAATGSANGAFSSYLVRHRVVDVQPLTTILSEQGFEMNRPSLLHLEVRVDAKTNEVKGVRVGGGVVISGRGEIILS
ncbi:MAG: PhzF family phenazine biosynthesis protein [Blastocatellia bacterium]